MAIKYYPNRIEKQSAPSIDRVMSKRKPQLIRGAANVVTNSLSEVISANTDWQLNAVKLTFSNATQKDFSAKIIGGRKVIENMNDYLWFQTPNTLPQKITMTSGFYNGTQLAEELETQLDANTAFSDLGLTFTVAYDPLTGLFSITPSSGTIRYLEINTMQTQRYRDSIAGHLFGFNSNTPYESAIESDTTVYGLNQEAWIIDEEDSAATENYFDDLKLLDLDQALKLETSTADVVVNYEVSIEEIV